MRAPGMPVPVTDGFMQCITAGPSYLPMLTEGAIGTSWFTPEQASWHTTRRRYGSTDDPDAGGYHLNQITFDKETGDAEMTALEATNDGWYAPAPSVVCGCSGPSCGCR